MATVDLDEILAFAIDTAKQAGSVIKEASQKRSSSHSAAVDEKMNSVDLVTETDQRVERIIIDAIKQKYPTHKFIGEESYAAGERPDLTDEPTWIVDPIDGAYFDVLATHLTRATTTGTTNFVHGFPFCCTSIGFAYQSKPTIGVVYNPFLDQLFHGKRGSGSFLNGEKLPLVQPKPLPSWGQALLAVEWGSVRNKDAMTKKANTYTRLAGDPKEIPGGLMAHSLRSLGSAALNFCYVGAGWLDAYWEIGCYSWDVCAGSVIATEAGGKAYGKNGTVFDAQALSGRYYFVIRGLPNTEQERGVAAQDRLTKDFHAAVENWDV